MRAEGLRALRAYRGPLFEKKADDKGPTKKEQAPKDGRVGRDQTAKSK